jgi:hypothetical protein
MTYVVVFRVARPEIFYEIFMLKCYCAIFFWYALTFEKNS